MENGTIIRSLWLITIYHCILITQTHHIYTHTHIHTVCVCVCVYMVCVCVCIYGVCVCVCVCICVVGVCVWCVCVYVVCVCVCVYVVCVCTYQHGKQVTIVAGKWYLMIIQVHCTKFLQFFKTDAHSPLP